VGSSIASPRNFIAFRKAPDRGDRASIFISCCRPKNIVSSGARFQNNNKEQTMSKDIISDELKKQERMENRMIAGGFAFILTAFAVPMDYAARHVRYEPDSTAQPTSPTPLPDRPCWPRSGPMPRLTPCR
jgi:hypothetical protein